MVIKCHRSLWDGDCPPDYVAGAKWGAYISPRNKVSPVSLTRPPNWTAGFYYYYEVGETTSTLTDAERAKRCIEDFNYLCSQGFVPYKTTGAMAKNTNLSKFVRTMTTEIP